MTIQCTLSRIFRGMAAAPWSIPALSKCLGQTQPITCHPQATWFSTGPVNRISFTSISWAAFLSAGTQLSSVTEHRDAGSSGTQLTHATSDNAFKGSTEYNKDENFGVKLPSATAKPVVESSNTYSDSESSWRKVPSATAKSMLKGSSGYNGGESSRTFATARRPKEIIDMRDIMNKVEFVGLIGEPVQSVYADAGQLLAWTTLRLRNHDNDGLTWLELLFWNELAETVVQHVKENDTVYVSGRLVSQPSTIKDDKSPKLYKVIANKLNYIGSPDHPVSEKVDVNNNIPFSDVHQQEIANRHTLSQHEESPVKSSTSGLGAVILHQQQATAPRHSVSSKLLYKTSENSGDHVATLQMHWEEFFISPDDWLDLRKAKEDSGGPDFRHKDTDTELCINNPSNPAWIESEFVRWDARRKALGEC